MGRLWLSLFVQAGVFLASPAYPAARPSDADLEFAEGYLGKFYNDRLQASHRMAGLASHELMAKPKGTQHLFELVESGELDQLTPAATRRGRSGLSDAEQFGETIRWRNRTLTYRISNYTPKMRPSQIRRVIREAWRLWAQVAPLTFRRRKRRGADIEISFNNKDHEDGAPFDGKGGTLAHAFLPGPGIGGDVHFDAEEDWTNNATARGCNLFATAVHEFGHALGLAHSSDPGAVMFPAYNFVPHGDVLLSFQDVKDIQELYGKSSIKLDRPPPKTPDKCDHDLSFDAVTELQQEVIFFKDRFMWRTHPDFEEIGITLITSLWTDIPSYMDAAYKNTASNTIVFFKGSLYWKVKVLEVKDGYPRNISDFGFPARIKSVDAALHFRETHLTEFFIGEECWRYDEEQTRMMDGYPKMITDEWPGVPSPIDASVAYEGLIYFFLGNQQLEFDPSLRRITSKTPANAWLKCGGGTNMISLD
ncbi:hypothetical protein SRHO_G00214480 [Serrasalmus rhombeus]